MDDFFRFYAGKPRHADENEDGEPGTPFWLQWRVRGCPVMRSVPSGVRRSGQRTYTFRYIYSRGSCGLMRMV